MECNSQHFVRLHGVLEECSLTLKLCRIALLTFGDFCSFLICFFLHVVNENINNEAHIKHDVQQINAFVS